MSYSAYNPLASHKSFLQGSVHFVFASLFILLLASTPVLAATNELSNIPFPFSLVETILAAFAGTLLRLFSMPRISNLTTSEYISLGATIALGITLLLTVPPVIAFLSAFIASHLFVRCYSPARGGGKVC